MARTDTDLVMICTSDISGQIRGKAIPVLSIEDRKETGIGWAPTNSLITSFGGIAPSPWGTIGDLMVRPDPTTLVDLELPQFGIDEFFMLGNIMQLDGTPWEFCLRNQLAAALRQLEEQHGLVVKASFEHEFHYDGVEAKPGMGYSLRSFRRAGAFPNRVVATLDAAGLSIDTFMPEYGAGQWEVTIKPKPALRAADEAIILRELVRSAALGMGSRASFTPVMNPGGVGNGVHVHFSLYDRAGTPVSHDPEQNFGVSKQAGSFIAGIVKAMPEFIAMTAPTVVSYLRLKPNLWSAAYNNFGNQDRESAVRICPVFGKGDAETTARKYHFEFRAADAAASPYLVMAALIKAGLSGLSDNLPTPVVTEGELSKMTPAQLKANQIQRLPETLDQALTSLTSSSWAKAAFGEAFVSIYNDHKRGEIELMANCSEEDMFTSYSQAY